MPTGELPPTDLETGEVLNGAWRLEEQIGEGGMGRVFRATDLKLSRKAAIKALSVNNLEEETVKRFEREAQVMGKLDHPGVVTLYGVGRTRGIPWLAMKHLEGQSLWGVLDDNGGLLPPAVLLPIARQLLLALGYIHGRGLLHRDLKPSNIHVGSTGKTTLLDLGLARGHRSALTRTGVIWGTPDYMAPEQIVGERQLDGRADLYAVSVVIYRMLSGVSPFPEEDEQDLMRAHLMDPRPDISRTVQSLSPLLGATLQKGLAIRPEDRFQNAEEMAIAIEKALLAPAREAPTAVRRRTGETPIATLDPTPKSGARRNSNPNLRKAEGETHGPATVVVVAIPDEAPQPRRGALEDDDDGGGRTQREGFQPVATDDPGATSADEDPDPREANTAPSEPLGRPLKRAAVREELSAPTDPMPPPLPAYLKPPFLIGAAVVVLVLGVLLGKLL